MTPRYRQAFSQALQYVRLTAARRAKGLPDLSETPPF